jgi:cytochrome c556
MKKLATLALSALVLTIALPAAAQFAKPEDAVKYRKNALFVMQQNYGRVAAMASGRVPFDPKVAAESAAVADFVGKLPWAAFGEGTDKGDTKAKPEIWMDKAKFDDYAQKMQTEMGKLNAAAKTGNLDSIKAAVTAVGGSCKTCHDAFRM